MSSRSSWHVFWLHDGSRSKTLQRHATPGEPGWGIVRVRIVCQRVLPPLSKAKEGRRSIIHTPFERFDQLLYRGGHAHFRSVSPLNVALKTLGRSFQMRAAVLSAVRQQLLRRRPIRGESFLAGGDWTCRMHWLAFLVFSFSLCGNRFGLRFGIRFGINLIGWATTALRS